MIYVCSKVEFIQRYWKTVFGKKFNIKNVDFDSFDFEQEFTSEDVLILDLDQFSSIDDTLESFGKVPKNLKTIAVKEDAKLAHGAYMIKKGFKSYLGKKTSNLIVEEAIKTVIKGNVWLYPELMNYIIKHININSEENHSSDVLEKLSSKEKEVANLVAQGMSNKEIGISMDVQLVTVKKHIGNIFSKLNVKDRVSLAILVNK